MNRQRQIDVIGTYNKSYRAFLPVDQIDFETTGRVANITDLIPPEMQTPGERLVLELTVTVRKADKNDRADGVHILADNPV